MKIYVTGPVGGGKTTLARELSCLSGLPCCELDCIVYETDPDHPGGNRKRNPEERDRLFQSVLSGDGWIMEDTGRFEEGWKQADFILLLEPPAGIRKVRIVKRWLRQRLCLEPSRYQPDFRMLQSMFRWTDRYERGESSLKERLAPYRDKMILLRSRHDLREILDSKQICNKIIE